MKTKLAIITTHPIQYNAPFFQRLAKEEGLWPKVFYTWGEGAVEKYDPGFNREIRWDIPLLEGYDFVFLANKAIDPGSHHFWGIINPTLIRDVESWNPDAILVYGWAFWSHLKLLRHFKGKKPLYFRGDSTLLDRQAPLKAWLRKTFLRWIYSHIDGAFYPGKAAKVYFEACGLRPGQLVWMPHAVDNNRFAREGADTDGKDWRSEKGIPGDVMLFVYAGKFAPKKNLSLLVEAFQEANMQNTQLLLVGNGPEEPGLKNGAAGCRNISFLPFQNQAGMPALLAAADVVVLPSAWGETWGLILNEAMAAGKPVLASDACGAAADLVVPGVNGYTFRKGEKTDLVHKLHTLTRQREALLAMGKNSAELIREWTFEKAAAVVRGEVRKIKEKRSNA